MIQSKYFCSVAFESLGCFGTQNTISVRMWHSYWFQSGRQLKFPVVELALGQIQWMLPFPPPPQHGHDHHCGQPLPLSPSSSAASLTPSAPSLSVASLTPSLSTQIIFQNHRTKGHLNGIQTLKYSGRIWQKSIEKTGKSLIRGDKLGESSKGTPGGGEVKLSILRNVILIYFWQIKIFDSHQLQWWLTGGSPVEGERVVFGTFCHVDSTLWRPRDFWLWCHYHVKWYQWCRMLNA